MIQWPNPLTGVFSPLAAWLNKLLSAARKCEPLESADFRIDFASNGYYLRSKVSGGGLPGKTLNANYQVMIITAMGSSLVPPLYDVLVCRSYNRVTNTIGNIDMYVAKETRVRRTVTKDFFTDNGANIRQTYGYFSNSVIDPTYADNFRNASDGSQVELEAVEERYITKDILDANTVSRDQAVIYVLDTGQPTGVKDPNGTDITLIETMSGRRWARVSSS